MLRSLRLNDMLHAHGQIVADVAGACNGIRCRAARGTAAIEARIRRERHPPVAFRSQACRPVSEPLHPTAPPLAGDAPAKRNLVIRYMSRFDDGEVLRWAFRGLLIGTIGVLGTDLADLSRSNGWWNDDAAIVAPEDPILPPAVETNAPVPSGDPRPFVTSDDATLRQPMTFSLQGGGVLSADGTIESGTAARFAAEIAARGEYVKTVLLNSPGGALDDAMAMARLVREHGIATEVRDGALCASSCPLLLAGGTTRIAGEKAAIGVHQFYASVPSDHGTRAGDGGRTGDDRSHLATSDRYGRRSRAMASCARYAAARALLPVAQGIGDIPAGEHAEADSQAVGVPH